MIEERLKGRLLVATPNLGDPNFELAVVLLLEHGQDGALGVVLNRPSDLDLAEPLPEWARAAAHPPVVTTSGTVREEVAAGAALLAPPGDVDALAAALEAAVDGGTEHRARGLEVAARHRWDASAEAHAAVYRSVG